MDSNNNSIPPTVKKQKLNNANSYNIKKELLEFHCKDLHDSGYYGCKYCERIYRSPKNDTTIIIMIMVMVMIIINMK